MASSQSAAGGLMLRGREAERAELDALLADARDGRSGVLVLQGDAGIGKTALLDYVTESASASGLTVLRAVGVESDMELAYAAIHQLCAPLLGHIDPLPDPQRHAIETTFGLREGPIPDRFLVGLAILSLFSEAADERPLVCVIDDAQWLDQASAQVLAFVARRLVAESVLLLIATRKELRDYDRLPALVVDKLQDADAGALLASAIPGRLDEQVAEQLLAEARGNPLALLELPRGLSPAQLAGGFGLPGALSLSGRIEQSFLNRLEALPDDTQQLLLVAAAEPTGDPSLLSRAAERLGIADAALAPAEAALLLEVGESVRFRHPLVRSAVYRAATPHQRRRAHRALAEATDAQIDPDRRAWHLAEATAGTDEEVAVELERAAGRAEARGGLAAAAAFLERAAGLTPSSTRRTARALAAARTAYESGALDEALVLIGTAEAGVVDDAQRAHVRLLRAQVAFALRRGRDAPPLLLQAARDLEATDPKLARTTYLEAFAAATFAGRLARGGSTAEVSEAVLAGPRPPEPPGPSDLLLQGLAIRSTNGYAAGVPILKEALRSFAGEKALPPGEAQWLWFAALIALDVWDDHAWRVLSTRHLELVRRAGALTALPFVLTNRSSVYASFGDLGAAVAYEEELQAATEATGIAQVPYGALSLAAWRGHEAEFSQLIRTTVSEAEARGEGLALTVATRLTGALYNGLGQYEAAFAALTDADRDDRDAPAMCTLGLTEVIEAAVRSGRPRLADGVFERIAQTTRASGTDWAVGMEARCRALLDEDGEAEGLYREAIERIGRTNVRVQLARSHLLYGEWLRRERRRVDAREQLRTALQMFNAMGIGAFVGRAQRELVATGERVGSRTVDTDDELTAQEAQVARLARDGLSNAEIGARLFISPHTVAYHLRKIFTKLGISSRSELGRVLPDNADAVAAA